MATIKNDRDVLIQAGPRAINPDNADVLLQASASAFHIANGGAHAPAAVTFKASRIGLSGPVVFTADGATVTSSGDEASLSYGDMSGDLAVITATIIENGESFSGSWAVSKTYDGANGSPGTNNAIVYAYRRSASAPSGLPGAVDYDFTTATITTATLANSWSKTVPAGTDPLYVTAATANSTTSTAAIAAGAWSAAVVLAQNGANGANGTNGSNGVAGLNSAPVLIYQRTGSATAPTRPSVATTYTFATGGLTGLNNGWTATVPASGGAYLHVSTATASATTATDSIPAAEWAAVTLMAQDGTAGAAGLTTSVLYAYQRAAVAPTLKPGAVTFTFASGTITTPATDALANGWTKTIPSGTNPLYVTVATAASTGATDTVADAEWATPVLLAQNGANGTNGTNGAAGLNSATVHIYQRNSTGVAPTLPSASTTYTFATGGLTGLNNGWTSAVPASSLGEFLFVSIATAANTTATDAIAAGEWAAAQIMAQDGKDGLIGLYPVLDDATWATSLGTVTTVAVTDGPSGKTAKRSAAGVSSILHSTIMLQFDKARTYRSRFWARASSTANGLLYHTLHQFLANGSTGPTNGGRAPYKPAGRTAASTQVWTEFSNTWTVADLQAGVTQVRPDFLLNQSGTVGYWEIQDYQFSDVTEVLAAQAAADAAQVGADAANAEIAIFADDNKLSAPEKHSQRLTWNTVVSEKAGINTTSTTYPATAALNTSYNTAFQALGTYLNAGAAYTISTTVPPTWLNDANLGVVTTIVGPTYRANWKAMTDARQALLNAIAVEAGQVSLWDGVTGNGRPADNATPGPADAATSMGFNPQFTDWPTGQQFPTGWSAHGWTPVKETSIVRTSPYAVGFVVGATSSPTGMTRDVRFGDHPMALGTYLRGSFDAYVTNNTNVGGSPGIYVRFWTAANYSTYHDTPLAILNKTLTGWQRTPFTATPPSGARIYGLQVFLLASDAAMTGGMWGAGSSIIFDNLMFDFQTKTTQEQIEALPPFTVSLSGTLLSTVADGQRTYGTKTATVVGGVGTLIYNWSVSYVSGEPSETVNVGITGGGTSAGFYGYGVDTAIDFGAVLSITDALNRTAVAGFNHSVIHGDIP